MQCSQEASCVSFAEMSGRAGRVEVIWQLVRVLNQNHMGGGGEVEGMGGAKLARFGT